MSHLIGELATTHGHLYLTRYPGPATQAIQYHGATTRDRYQITTNRDGRFIQLDPDEMDWLAAELTAEVRRRQSAARTGRNNVNA